MQNPKIVTCNYTNLYSTRFNGRLNRDFIYMYSLRGIAECGESIVDYTCQYNMDICTPYFQAQNITNITQIDYDLVQSPYHARIEAIKDINPKFYTETSWLNRCMEIMIGKFVWMEEQLANLEEDDYLWWLDAGISHGGIISRDFNTFEGNPAYYKQHKPDEMELEYAHRHDVIFNKDFIPRLEKYAGEQILLITANHDQHGDALGFTYTNHLRAWPIGGIFGGKKKMLIPFIQAMKEKFELVLNANLLCKEEQLMAVVLNEHPEWFKTFMFETWYHKNWSCFNSKLIPFCKFFEDLLSI